jgi:hypothetical protein
MYADRSHQETPPTIAADAVCAGSFPEDCQNRPEFRTVQTDSGETIMTDLTPTEQARLRLLQARRATERVLRELEEIPLNEFPPAIQQLADAFKGYCSALLAATEPSKVEEMDLDMMADLLTQFGKVGHPGAALSQMINENYVLK